MAGIAKIAGRDLDDIAKVAGKVVIGLGDAAVGNVSSGKTFYAGDTTLKTGTMATVALDPALNAYPAGYHVGAASLTAVDADLATGNIKSGVTIFGVAGAATVQDISDADLTVAEAPTGKKFYAVTGGVKTGTGTKTLDPASEVVAAGYYAATTLSAVDADLAVENIKSGVTIFGKLGTYTSTLAEDFVAGVPTTDVCIGADIIVNNGNTTVDAGSDKDRTSTTRTFAANSRAVAVGFFCGRVQPGGYNIKLRLYMNGVQVAESGIISGTVGSTIVIVGTAALSGSKICKISLHNYEVSNKAVYWYGQFNDVTTPAPYGIGVGNIKVT